MKKLYKILPLLIIPTLLTGCDFNSAPPSYVPPVDNNTTTEVVDSSTTTSEIKELVFDDFKDAIETCKATKASTLVNYYVPNYEVTLNYSSTLTIEYSTPLKAEYKYTTQHLNPIGSDEMISTKSGTDYVVGNSIGELENGNINWSTNSEAQIALVSFQFQSSLFENIEIKDNTFKGRIIDEKITQFFKKFYDFKNVNLSITLDETRSQVETINLTYVDNVTHASVEITTTYAYDLFKVNVPNM